MRLSVLALIFCLFVFGMRGATVTWLASVTSGDWSNANNWIGGAIPAVGDIAVLVGGTTVSVSSQITIDTINFGAAKLIVTNNALLTVNNQFIPLVATNIQVDSGSTLNIAQFVFNGQQINFVNFGSITTNPLVTGAYGVGSLTNVATGNNVFFYGTKTNQINANFYVPSGFTFGTIQQTFATTILGATLTLGYTENVNNWIFDNPTNALNLVLQNGANINGAITVTNTGVLFPRPTVTFAGAINVVNTLTMDCVPVVGNGGVVVISGQTLNFFNYGVTISASRVQGTGSFNFNNQNVPPTTASFSQATSIENANFNFLNNWIFSGAVTYNVPKSFGFNVTLNSGSSITFKQATTLATSSFFISGGGQLTFTDSIISNNAITFTGFNPTFDCSLPNKAFAITGNSQLSFPAGLTVNGCAVSSSAQLTVSVSLTTVGGNTTLPTSPSSIVFNNGITFNSPNSPTNSLYCVLLAGQITVPNAQAYTANRVEVVLPASPTFVVSDNAQLNSLNGGLFTLSGGVQFGSGINTGATLAFNSGTPSITSTARVDLSGALLLRNTVISGTADIWFNGQSITSTKGVSTISNPNFKFKQGLTLNYLWDQNFPNTGCQLVINNGPSGVRVIEKDVTANPGSNIVFDDNVNFNTSVTVSGSVNGNVIGAVTFRQTGQAQGSVTTNAVVTLNRNIYVNNTNFHFMGIGNYLFGNNANLFVQGNINNPTIAGDAVVTSNTPLTVGVVANSTFGNTFIVNSDLTTDDLDGIATTAVSKLTLNNAVGQSRNINGAYTLGASLTFAGNVVVQNGATINTPGTIEILGSSITLQASPTWRNKVVFPGAMTVSSTNGANTLTLGEQNILHGLNIPTTFTVNNPASVTFDSLYTVNFLTASTLSGTGAVTFSNTFATSSGLVTISPQTVTFTNVSLVGTGSFNVNPVDANLNIGTFVRAFVPTTYPGATLQVNGATTISNLVSFTANPLTINGNVLTISPGAYSVNTRWVNNNNGIVFQGIVTLATTGSFAGTGTLTFNNTLALTQSTTISQNVIFGLANNYIVTVSNAGFVLTLTGSSVTVNSLVVSNGGSIVSTSQPLSVQTISGGGSINSDWTWTNTVKFGQLNVTGARTLTFSLLLTSGSTTYFNDGVTFNGGTFDTSVSSDTPTLGIEKSITTNQNTLLVPNIAVRITGTTFTFGGSNVLTLNGTVDCFATVTFNTNVIFGYATPTTGNTITLRAGSTGWFPASASIQVWRTSFVTDNTVVATIAPSLIFGLDSIAFTTNGNGRLTLNGNLNVLGTSFSTSSNVFLGVISINSAQNNTLSNLNLLGTLTLNSSTIPWVEPVVSINTFTQTLVLNGPARMNTPIFGPKAQVVGPARLAITNSLEVQSTFQFGAPVQLYVNSPAGVFTFKLTNSQTNLLFTSTPSLFNPLGYNTVLATNFALNSDSQANILRFALNSQLTVGDLYVNAGILQFSGSSVSSYQTTVAGGATLWIDGSAFTGNQVIFNQNNDGTNPSVYQLTISSANPPAITTQAVVYKGIASLAVVNFNWDGTPITGITATSTNGATANFLTVTGNAGYQYSSTRSGNNVQFRRSANPSVSPFPTQSNGPSPAVSSSSTIVFSVYLMISIFLFVFFN